MIVGIWGAFMKKIYAINGSPRKNKNTAILLDNVLEGAKNVDPDTLVGQMHPPSLFLESLSRAASEAYSFNDRQGCKGVHR